MNILGLSVFLDDPAAALIQDGKIVAICEEERFTRVRHGVRFFKEKIISSNKEISFVHDFEVRELPIQSIEFCLKKAHLSLRDIDFICVGFDFGSIISQKENLSKAFAGLPKQVVENRIWASGNYVRFLEKLARRAHAKLVFVRHHIAHAYGAIFGSGFRRCIVLTMDEMGEFDSTLLGFYSEKDQLEIISDVALPNSMGRVYACVTNFLGFRSNFDEEKVMALAAYGSPIYREKFGEVVRIAERDYFTTSRYFWDKNCAMGFTNRGLLQDFFNLNGGQASNNFKKPYTDIASSLQKTLFDVSNKLVSNAIDVSGYQSLCLSGGVALNCSNNGKLLLENSLDEIYVQPQANDAGVAIGAAYYLYFKLTGKRGSRLDHVYYGPSYTDDEIRSILKKYKLKYDFSEDLCGEVALKIANGDAVAWFQGAAEIGPRALGNRSILASPARKTSHRKLSAIKGREWWRPFAISLLDEQRNKFLSRDMYLPFMNVSLPLTPHGIALIKSGKHIDNTTRPQTLKREINPLFYKLISEFERITGVPALVNTSFNVRDEPLVNSVQDAIGDFFTTKIDTLVLGKFILKK